MVCNSHRASGLTMLIILSVEMNLSKQNLSCYRLWSYKMHNVQVHASYSTTTMGGAADVINRLVIQDITYAVPVWWLWPIHRRQRIVFLSKGGEIQHQQHQNGFYCTGERQDIQDDTSECPNSLVDTGSIRSIRIDADTDSMSQDDMSLDSLDSKHTTIPTRKRILCPKCGLGQTEIECSECGDRICYQCSANCWHCRNNFCVTCRSRHQCPAPKRPYPWQQMTRQMHPWELMETMRQTQEITSK